MAQAQELEVPNTLGIPTPDMLRAEIYARLVPEIEQLIQQLVEKLRKNYDPLQGRAVLSLPEEENGSAAVRNAVVHRFEQAGWSLRYQDDQKGSYWEVMPLRQRLEAHPQ